MFEPGVVTVLVGRFDPLMSHGVAAVLRKDDVLRVVVDESGDLEGLIAREAPAVAIVDKVTERSLSQREWSLWSGVGIVVVAHNPPVIYGMLLLAAGLSCLSSNASAADILGAVRIAAQGGCVFLADGGDRFERHDRSKNGILTRREVEVLTLVNGGESDAKIALRLDISIETVRKHVANLRRKLKVSHRSALVGIQIPACLTAD
jgi:DNA-binding NarL/FixJ family response regulator